MSLRINNEYMRVRGQNFIGGFICPNCFNGSHIKTVKLRHKIKTFCFNCVINEVFKDQSDIMKYLMGNTTVYVSKRIMKI